MELVNNYKYNTWIYKFVNNTYNLYENNKEVKGFLERISKKLEIEYFWIKDKCSLKIIGRCSKKFYGAKNLITNELNKIYLKFYSTSIDTSINQSNYYQLSTNSVQFCYGHERNFNVHPRQFNLIFNDFWSNFNIQRKEYRLKRLELLDTDCKCLLLKTLNDRRIFIYEKNICKVSCDAVAFSVQSNLNMDNGVADSVIKTGRISKKHLMKGMNLRNIRDGGAYYERLRNRSNTLKWKTVIITCLPSNPKDVTQCINNTINKAIETKSESLVLPILGGNSKTKFFYSFYNFSFNFLEFKVLKNKFQKFS